MRRTCVQDITIGHVSYGLCFEEDKVSGATWLVLWSIRNELPVWKEGMGRITIGNVWNSGAGLGTTSVWLLDVTNGLRLEAMLMQ
jgi:hypothetical protein